LELQVVYLGQASRKTKSYIPQ